MEDSIECPYCKEEIKPTAEVCRYCGRDVKKIIALIEENVYLKMILDEKKIPYVLKNDTNTSIIPSKSLKQLIPISVISLGYLLLITLLSFPMFAYFKGPLFSLFGEQIFAYQMLLFLVLPIFIYLIIKFSLNNNVWIYAIFISVQPFVIHMIDSNEIPINHIVFNSFVASIWIFPAELILLEIFLLRLLKKEMKNVFNFSPLLDYMTKSVSKFDTATKFINMIITIMSLYLMFY